MFTEPDNDPIILSEENFNSINNTLFTPDIFNYQPFKNLPKRINTDVFGRKIFPQLSIWDHFLRSDIEWSLFEDQLLISLYNSLFLQYSNIDLYIKIKERFDTELNYHPNSIFIKTTLEIRERITHLLFENMSQDLNLSNDEIHDILTICESSEDDTIKDNTSIITIEYCNWCNNDMSRCCC
jgi:hypothetical protein